VCAVSLTHDYMRQNILNDQWTRDTVQDLTEVMRLLDALDKKLEQPVCVDPSKAKYLEELQARFGVH